MKPNLWFVMNAFKKEDSVARNKVVALAAGNYTDPNPSRTKMIAEKKVKLKAAICNYHSMVIKNWLNRMSTFYESYRSI